MYHWKNASTAFALVALAACGGGDSGGSAPGPAGSQTPTPASSPSVTPTPSPSYDPAFNFQADRAFDVQAVQMITVFGKGSNGAFSEYESSRAELWPHNKIDSITYQHALQATTISSPPDDTWVFSGADILNRSESGIIYSQSNGSYTIMSGFITWPDLMYVGSGALHIWRIEDITGVEKEIETYRNYLYGSPTIISDIPKAGMLAYQLNLVEHNNSVPDTGAKIASGPLEVDFATGIISGTLTPPSPLLPNRLIFDGIIDSQTNWISGTISSQDIQYSGEFAGRVYGPKGREMALFYAVTAHDGIEMTGHIVGKANVVTLP